MRKYRMGELEAFDQLYRRHANRVYEFLRRRLPETVLDDAFQEVWMKLHKSRDKFDERFAFIPWVYTLTRNVMIDRLRTIRRNKEVHVEPEHLESPESSRGPVYAEALASLAAGEKQVVSMHYEWGLSFREIADRLGIEPAAARKTSSRAIQKLRGIFRVRS